MKRNLCILSVAVSGEFDGRWMWDVPEGDVLVQVGSLQGLAKGEYDGIAKLSELPVRWPMGAWAPTTHSMAKW